MIMLATQLSSTANRRHNIHTHTRRRIRIILAVQEYIFLSLCLYGFTLYISLPRTTTTSTLFIAHFRFRSLWDCLFAAETEVGGGS